jgi:hypothetical protein
MLTPKIEVFVLFLCSISGVKTPFSKLKSVKTDYDNSGLIIGFKGLLLRASHFGNLVVGASGSLLDP